LMPCGIGYKDMIFFSSKPIVFISSLLY
jgi:hypothetical protein